MPIHPIPSARDCKGKGIETSTYNPNSKWDSYELGGDWSLFFQSVQGATVSEFLTFAQSTYEHTPFLSFAILTPNGEWIEKGIVLNYGFVKDAMSDEDWQAQYFYVLGKFSDHRVLIYNCHI